jgi:hypothetical protein
VSECAVLVSKDGLVTPEKKKRKQNALSIGSSEDSTAVYIQMKI